MNTRFNFGCILLAVMLLVISFFILANPLVFLILLFIVYPLVASFLRNSTKITSSTTSFEDLFQNLKADGTSSKNGTDEKARQNNKSLPEVTVVKSVLGVPEKKKKQQDGNRSKT